MIFWPPRVGVILKRFLHIYPTRELFIYPRQWSCFGYIVSPWMSSCLSFCLSVCLWKCGFWHITHTMTILHTCLGLDLRRTSIDLGVKRSKVKVKFGFKTVLPFPHHSCIFFYHWNDSISHKNIYKPWPKEDLYWFCGQNVKIQYHIFSLN